MSATVEVRVNDKVIYCQTVAAYTHDLADDGTFTFAATQEIPETVAAAAAPVILAFDTDQPHVLETVHTGDAYTSLSATVTVDGVDQGPGEVGHFPDDAPEGLCIGSAAVEDADSK